MSDPRDHDGFMELYLKVQPTLRSYIFALVHDMAEAEDILQEVSTVLWRDLARYNPALPFVNWAVGIARNHINNWRRSRARSRTVLVPTVEAKLADTFSDLQAELEHRRRALRECVEKVTPWARELLDLRYEREYTLSKIAQLKQTTLNAINKALGRVRAFLVKCTGADRDAVNGLETP